MEYTKEVTLSLFGREFSMTVCIWHRMVYSNLEVHTGSEYSNSQVYNMMEIEDTMMENEMANGMYNPELSIEDEMMEDKRWMAQYEMDYSNPVIADSVKYSIVYDDENGGMPAKLIKEYSTELADYREELQMDSDMQEMMEYYMEYDGLDVMDAIDKMMEDYMDED